jgi:hypothetical protein
VRRATLGLVALLAACGGGTTYSAGATSLCLGKIGVVSTRDRDTVGAIASSGAYQFTIGKKIVNLAFGKNAEEAEDLLIDYGAVARERHDRLYRRGNVVLSWIDEPGPARPLVERCLQT